MEFNPRWPTKLFLFGFFMGLQVFALDASAQNLELYVDSITKQVFTEPGPGRTKLGSFEPADNKPRPSVSSTPNAAMASATSSSSTKSNGDKQWFDALSIRGYTQLRYTDLWSHDGADFYHPADRTIAEDQSFLIRRGRLILSGDVSEHLYVYLQPDFNASPSDGDFSAQLRDFYGDVAIDKKKEFRFRLGQSKVPFGFVNLQSSQNRLNTERADALNSAAEGERDIGAFMYWAPKEIRERFRKLIKDGLKGSGDYGVIGLGAYNGQGLNRSDTNGELHSIARASYPFQLESGQFFEAGVQAYTGRFLPRTQGIAVDPDSDPSAPKVNSNGVKDERYGISAVLYPQPIGFEAEWNWGQGPELSEDFSTIRSRSLQGGYLLANVKMDSSAGVFFPFIRWQYYDGGRKFGRNAPHVNVNEWDFGVEYQPVPEFELAMQYTFTNRRTNSNSFAYEDLTDGSRLAFQAQFNY